MENFKMEILEFETVEKILEVIKKEFEYEKATRFNRNCREQKRERSKIKKKKREEKKQRRIEEIKIREEKRAEKEQR